MYLYENERIKVFPETDVDAYIRYFRNQGYTCHLEGNEIVIGKPIASTYNYKNLGCLIYKKRTEKGISRGYFAKMVEVNVDTVYNWEIGQRMPFKYNLERIMKILDITEEELKGCQI